MTPKERAAMQQALEALDIAYGLAESEWTGQKYSKALTALREALDHSTDTGNMTECRHCGFLCKPNTDESRKWYPLEQPKFIPVGIVNDHHSITWIEEIVDDQAPIGAILYALQDSVGRNVSFAKEQK